MSKRKPRDEASTTAASTTKTSITEAPSDDAPKPEVIIPDPPQPNAAFLGTTAVAYFLWLGFLIWMALAR